MSKSQKKVLLPDAKHPAVKAAKAKPAAKQADKKETSQKHAIGNGSKQSMLITLLERSAGATVEEMSKATGWQNHSVLGTISGVLRKRLGLIVESAKEQRGRVYRIA